ncbi:hypothetical protein BVRB_8g184540 [Beta vulgaris subsp. vulgaris]|nr:hypothetical protein BVRB_8g184540 [Beta vulgaris subsp. vulgaris]
MDSDGCSIWTGVRETYSLIVLRESWVLSYVLCSNGVNSIFNMLYIMFLKDQPFCNYWKKGIYMKRCKVIMNIGYVNSKNLMGLLWCCYAEVLTCMDCVF